MLLLHVSRSVLLTIASIFFWIGQAAGQTTDASFDPGLADVLQQALEQSFARWGVPGASAAVTVDGQGMWIGTAGSNDAHHAEDVTPDLIFGMASITKTVAATTIMLLAEEGKIGLDDRIGDYLAPLPRVDPNVTVRQILNHTSGINNHTNHFALRDSIVANFDRFWTPAEVFDRFVGIPFWAPGTAWRYSNSNYLLAGLLIQAASGQPVSETIRSRIFEPLGMTNMYLSTEEHPTGTLAKGWSDLDGNGNLNNTISWYSPAWQSISWTGGAMFSTAEDLVRFGDALFGGRIVQQESLDEMMTFEDNGGNGYGLGVIRYRPFEIDFFGHSGNTVGYSSYLACSIEFGICGAVLVNQTARPARQIVFDLIEKIREFQRTVTSASNELPDAGGGLRLEIYPNPTASHVTVSFRSGERLSSDVSVTILDILGREVETAGVSKSAGSSVKLDVSSLVPGVYICQVATGLECRDKTVCRFWGLGPYRANSGGLGSVSKFARSWLIQRLAPDSARRDSTRSIEATVRVESMLKGGTRRNSRFALRIKRSPERTTGPVSLRSMNKD